jgi:hypothetical protein
MAEVGMVMIPHLDRAAAAAAAAAATVVRRQLNTGLVV